MRNKILFYIDSMQRGGAQRVMTNLLSYFSDSDYEVVLVNDESPKGDVQEYAIDSRVIRKYLKAKSSNILKKNIMRIRELRHIIKNEKPDMVISFLGPPNIRILLATTGIETKTIVSVRNDPNREYGVGIRKIVARVLFRRASGCVFQTEEARQYFSRKTQKKSKVIYNPVSNEFFEQDWKQNGAEIVVIGRLEKQKNPLLAINAFLMIMDEIPRYELVFYGDGSLRESLEQYVSEKNASGRIKFQGRIENVENVLSNAALYVMSSDFEGMPNALMEAMAVGTPCISTDCPCGGPKELLAGAEDIQLVPCANVESLAASMKGLLTNDAFRFKCSEVERNLAKRFNRSEVLENWMSYIRSV